MEPKHDSLWEKICQVKPSVLFDRVLVKCVMFFLDLGLAFYENGSKDRLSLEHAYSISKSQPID